MAVTLFPYNKISAFSVELKEPLIIGLSVRTIGNAPSPAEEGESSPQRCPGLWCVPVGVGRLPHLPAHSGLLRNAGLDKARSQV